MAARGSTDSQDGLSATETTVSSDIGQEPGMKEVLEVRVLSTLGETPRSVATVGRVMLQEEILVSSRIGSKNRSSESPPRKARSAKLSSSRMVERAGGDSSGEDGGVAFRELDPRGVIKGVDAEPEI